MENLATTKKNLEYAKEVFGLTEYSEEEENEQSSRFPNKNSNDHTSMLIPKAVSILVPETISIIMREDKSNKRKKQTTFCETHW